MTKKDQKIVLKTMEYLKNRGYGYSCHAISKIESNSITDSPLRTRYAKFFNKKNGYWPGLISFSGEKVLNKRLTMLALFLVAEKDVI